MPDNIVNVDFRRHFPLQQGDLLLDLGCGNGRHTLEASRFPVRVVGLDFSRDDLNAARFMYADLIAGEQPALEDAVAILRLLIR